MTQLPKLQVLIETVLKSNPFYSAKLRAAGIDRPPDTLGEYSKQFPLTTKTELIEDQKRNPPFGTNLSCPIANYSRFHQTSGTSGQPMRWLDTAESWDWV